MDDELAAELYFALFDLAYSRANKSGLPYFGQSIFFMTRMITYHIGLHMVLHYQFYLQAI